ncbi:MAG TPA: ribokinase [Aliiroseovarius sp.]|nr:ribokinase [Aliiroseovarius sp.]
MTVFNLGSINVDHFYQVPHLPSPGETLAATSFQTGLGGKGANQSVAASLAGSAVVHIGAVGKDGAWATERLAAFGVDVTHVIKANAPTAHAIINIDTKGENAIVVYSGANVKQSLTQAKKALALAKPGDTLLLQNETDLQPDVARLAKDHGLKVIYSAAPFSPDAVREMLPFTDVLVVNKVEAKQLRAAFGDIPVANLLITRGSKGSVWQKKGGPDITAPAFPVDPVDTTGAGDCFIGSVAAALDQGMSRADAMRFASAASAIQVTRPGTADAIPSRAETEAFLAERGSE